MTLRRPILIFLLVAVSVASFVVLFFCKPIPQDESFHHFADTRTILSVANFWNVISNIVFLIVGITASQKIRQNKLKIVPENKTAYYTFFAGISLVAFGSAWYHYQPGNASLAWDRLPMTIAFMSLLSIGFTEFFDVRTGRILLGPFLLTGIGAIAWWRYTELLGHGDLRLYALVQFLPILLLTLLFFFGSTHYTNNWGYVALFIAYSLAKLAEYFDAGIYQLSGRMVAGHFLKHIVIGAGLWLFLIYLLQRKPASETVYK